MVWLRRPSRSTQRDAWVRRAPARRLRGRGGGELGAQLMGCSITDPVGCLTSLAGGAASSIADSAFSSIAKDFADAAGSAVNSLWNQISGATAISLTGPAFGKDLAIVTTLAAVVATGLFIIQVIASVLRREGVAWPERSRACWSHSWAAWPPLPSPRSCSPPSTRSRTGP